MFNSDMSSHISSTFEQYYYKMHNVHVSMFDYEPVNFMVLVLFPFMCISIEMHLWVAIVNIMFALWCQL